ncbi:hypothetical protein PIB30_041074 [Stylosanthes scabra]|uniref:Uncharacterized protein n=1 Tax=Stylosanthes scabra TaxID=79078 RepID=A0ABU6WES8_9FABA|nr:hypothetical protein [Stylosanthes scabra]
MERWAGMQMTFGLVRKSCRIPDAARQYVGGVEVCYFAQHGAVGTMLVRRVAYHLLNLFLPNQFMFKVFWVEGDAHVRAMFELHRRYGSRDVMELLTEMQTVHVDAGGSASSSQGGPGAILVAPIQFATLEVSDDDSDEDFVGNMDDSSESSGGSEFVLES